MHASEVLLISGDKGFAIFDKDFEVYSYPLDYNTKGTVYYVGGNSGKFTIVFGNKESKQLSTTTRVIPRQYHLPESVAKDFNGRSVLRIELS